MHKNPMKSTCQPFPKKKNSRNLFNLNILTHFLGRCHVGSDTKDFTKEEWTAQPDLLKLSKYRRCVICRPSKSMVSEDAGTEPETVATFPLAVRRSKHSARSYSHLARSHPHSARSHPHLVRSHPHPDRSNPHLVNLIRNWELHPHSARSHQQSPRSPSTLR